MERPPARLCVILAAVAMSGCGVKLAGKTPTGAAGAGDPITGEGGGGGAGGTGGKAPPPVIAGPDGGPSDVGASERPIGMSTPDANCGAKSKSATKLPPDVLLVFDRSNSMNNNVKTDAMCTGAADGGFMPGNPPAAAGCGKDSKWAAVTPAITQVIAETENDVNWGLKFFPAVNNDCAVSATVAVPVAPKNAAAIEAAITAATNTTGGVLGFNGTPTRSAVTGATQYLQTLTDMNPKFILLATDGVPTCTTGSNDAPGSIAAVEAARTANYKTFVVGIATAGTGMADDTLSSMANAGGLPRTGTPTYYPVASTSDLSAAIEDVDRRGGDLHVQGRPDPDRRWHHGPPPDRRVRRRRNHSARRDAHRWLRLHRRDDAVGAGVRSALRQDHEGDDPRRDGHFHLPRDLRQRCPTTFCPRTSRRACGPCPSRAMA